ncbi:RPAP1-like protein [Kickxella alabastrina]|uniref:RPAP1-like protein n=1 Tax=Kickxella alabastrina TaxID=61397 RepID=UPI0022207E50|nr:RPAP1-like protein [Kickxella alabastrina]KAI7831926.1 RPAP1-like protein [Kickxella alabastrina]
MHGVGVFVIVYFCRKQHILTYYAIIKILNTTMEDTYNTHRVKDNCRFDFGSGDDDLEAMEREFLSSKTKPAAKVIRRSQAPEIVETVHRKAPVSDIVAPPSLPSLLLSPPRMQKQWFGTDRRHVGFAQRMNDAIKEFEVKERLAEHDSVSKARTNEGHPREEPKKLSLFAQRRLAKQSQNGGTVAMDRTVYTTPGASANNHSLAATFMPKLMAPVPEHSVVDPLKLREAADKQGSAYWAGMRDQVSQENEDRLRNMSAEEILEAQNNVKHGSGSTESESEIIAEPEENNNAKLPKQVRFAEPGSSMDGPVTGDPKSTLPPPPPPAEWVDEPALKYPDRGVGTIDVDNNETGADSEFYTDMKRKYFPSEMVEEAKLAWILGHNQARSPMEHAENLLARPISHVRFAFDGQIMTEEQSEIPTQAGLHHHGEDPDKPGYTIPELLHLSRSTRSVSISSLGCILHKINVGAWEVAQSVEVYLGLVDWQAELYFAHGIADSNKTCRAEATVALWTWVVEMSKYKSLVRLATGGDVEAQGAAIPGSEINMLPQPGVLVNRTFKAFSAILTPRLWTISLMPDQQLTLLAECIKCLMDMSDDFASASAGMANCRFFCRTNTLT